jgi:hypothetical protein
MSPSCVGRRSRDESPIWPTGLGRCDGAAGSAAPAESGGDLAGEPRLAATLGDVSGPVPGGAWHGPWHARRVLPARPVLSVRLSVVSVQPVRPVHGSVLMVRRRPTVRFRNGAPGHKRFSNESNDRRGTSRKRRASAPMAAKPPTAQPEPARQLLKAAAGRPSGDSLVSARRGHARPAVRRPGGCRPGEPHHYLGRPGGCWCHPARQARGQPVPGSRPRALDGEVTREVRTPARRFMPSGSGTSSSWTG